MKDLYLNIFFVIFTLACIHNLKCGQKGIFLHILHLDVIKQFCSQIWTQNTENFGQNIVWFPGKTLSACEIFLLVKENNCHFVLASLFRERHFLRKKIKLISILIHTGDTNKLSYCLLELGGYQIDKDLSWL